MQGSVKEKQLMQKFFIAPKDSAAVKPQVVHQLVMYLEMLTDNRIINYRNGFSFLFACLHYPLSKLVHVH